MGGAHVQAQKTSLHPPDALISSSKQMDILHLALTSRGEDEPEMAKDSKGLVGPAIFPWDRLAGLVFCMAQ